MSGSMYGCRRMLQRTLISNGCSRNLSTSTVRRVVPWQAPDVCKDLIGPRTVIVTMNDDLSKELSQRMWFEMQRCGIQSTFITSNTPYPTLANLQESISLFRRTGAKSLITIGNGAVSDYGKAIRGAVETALPINQFLKNKSINYVQREKIPLLSFGSTPSIVHYLPSFQVLHHEDDILVSGVGRPAEVVGFDPSLSTVSQYQDLAIEKVYLMANFFDAIFSMAFSQLKLGKDAKATDDMIRQVLTQEKLVNNLQADFHGNVADASSALENESKFINAVQAVALSRSHIQHHIVKPDPNCWPGLIEITSMLASMDPKQEQLLPFSFHAVKIFHDLLTKIITSKDQYYREDDLKMMDALLLAKAHTLSHFTIDSKEGDLIQLAAQANAAVSQQIKKYPKLFTKKLKDNNESLTAAGHLEKVSISLDMEIEQNGGQLQGSELRKAVLQGDVMVDLVEQILR